MRLYSRSAFIAALVGLGNHVLASGNLLGGQDSAEELWSALLYAMFVVPSLIALAAAFTRSSVFRAAALTAAFVSFLVPSFALLAVYFMGLLYIPGVVAVLVAAVRNVFAIRHIFRAILSVGVGLLAGIAMVIAYWPMGVSYDSCGSRRILEVTTDGREIVHCEGAISLVAVATGAGILAAALLLLLLTAVFVEQRRNSAIDAA